MKATSFSRVTSIRQTTCLYQSISLSLHRLWLAQLKTAFSFRAKYIKLIPYSISYSDSILFDPLDKLCFTVNYITLSLPPWEPRWPHDWRASLRIQRSGFKPWSRILCFVLLKDSLLAQCFSQSRFINEYRLT